MKNYKTLIFAVLIIFLLSGVYALYMDNNSIPITPTVKKSIISDNNIENNTASNVGIVLEDEVLTNSYQTNNTNPSTSLIKKPKVPESFNTKFEYMEFYKIYDSDYYGQKDNATFKKLPGTNITVEDYDYDDLYLQCPICGKYIALGDVTKKLPSEAICLDGCGAGSSNIIKEIVLLNSYTYEEAYMHWLNHNNQQENNNQHNIGNNTNSEPLNNQNTNASTNTQSGSGINPAINPYNCY